MRFLRVVLSIALLVGGIPFSVAAEDGASDDTQTTVIAMTDAEEKPAEEQAQDSLPLPTVTPEAGPQPTPHIQELSTENLAEPPLVRVAPIITEVQMSGKCVAAKCTSTNSAEFIELYNPSEQELSLAGYSLVFTNKSGTKSVLATFGAGHVIAPHQFVIMTHDIDRITYPSEDGTPVTVSPLATFTASLVDGDGAVQLLDTLANPAAPAVVDQVAWGTVVTGYYVQPAIVPSSPIDKPLQRCFVDGAVRTFDPRDTSKEFIVYGNELATPGRGLQCPVSVPPKPVNACDGLRINEIAANVTEQFIEIQNVANHDLSLDGCQLQTNRSATKAYVFGPEILPAGALRMVHIKDTPLTLTKTTSGIVYVLSSDAQTEVDAQAYTNLASGTSWARTDEGLWMQTYAVTPGAENVIQKYLPCDDGYERNMDTGRCNKIVVASVLADCGEGKYRSEETNRCRNIVTASIQKPCKDNQYRSEETNRCRTLPTTNVPESAFAVQPVKDTGMAFVGWWALGGVALLAAGYGVWEWRHEVRSGISKLISRISAGK